MKLHKYFMEGRTLWIDLFPTTSSKHNKDSLSLLGGVDEILFEIAADTINQIFSILCNCNPSKWVAWDVQAPYWTTPADLANGRLVIDFSDVIFTENTSNNFV